MSGFVYQLYLAKTAGATMRQIRTANLIEGQGIEGDRYFAGKGTFSEKLKGKPHVELTLIEKEEIDWFNQQFVQNHHYADLRRSIITQNIRLNELVDQEFLIGEVRVKGIRLCEPCSHLAETVNSLFLPNMIGRSGLRAQILSTGTVSLRDSISLIR